MIDLELTAAGDAKVEVKDLIGQALDFWVCLCLGQPGVDIMALRRPTRYSSNWNVGGPLIQAQNIAITPMPPAMTEWAGVWPRPAKASKLILPQSVQNGPPRVGMHGPTPLIAAMRAFVAGVAGPGILLPAHYYEVYQRELEAVRTEQPAENRRMQ